MIGLEALLSFRPKVFNYFEVWSLGWPVYLLIISAEVLDNSSPMYRLIFWTEVEVERIGKAFMDGTSKKYIITNKIRWPNGVAIDFTAERLYWTDGYNEIVESSDLNGGDRRVVYNDKRIMKVDKTSERRTKFMDSYPELNVLVGLQVYSNNYTIDVNPLCSRNNGLCSTFCFPTPTGRTCGCQDNTELLSDQKTCEGVSVCPTSLTNLQLLDCGAYSHVNLNARTASIEQTTYP